MPVWIGRVIRKLAVFVASLLVASVLIFLATNALPGDITAVILGTDASPEAVARLQAELGLDQPLAMRYFSWISGFLTGNLGTSMLSGDSVSTLMAPRIEVSASLVILGLVGSLVVALPLGMLSALKRRNWPGFTINAVAQIGMAVPVFWSGILLVLVFSIWLQWLPPNGYVPITQDFGRWFTSLILPVITLAGVQAAVMTRYVRSAFVEVLNEDYYTTARAVGWTPFRALVRHGVRNASISLVTVSALQVSSALVGAIVIEQVFVLPGLGTLLLNAVSQRDLVVVQGTVMFLVLVVLTINALVDLSYLIIDPRQRANLGERG